MFFCHFILTLVFCWTLLPQVSVGSYLKYLVIMQIYQEEWKKTLLNRYYINKFIKT